MENQKKKNIVFYFSDQQRWDTLNREIMPNLSEIAMQGVTYDSCYTCQPVCGPARACLQSGVYATKSGCYKNGISLPDSIIPLARCFNEAGYDTAYIGKWHLASDARCHCEKKPVPKERLGDYRYFRGADVLEFTSHGYGGYVFDENGNRMDFDSYRADAINGFALEYLDSVSSEQPFFLFVSQLEPHHQNDRKCFEGYKETVEQFKNYKIPEDLTAFKGDYEENYADYLSAVNRIDYNLGLLVNKLKEKGIYEDTVIVYTSDHGCHFKTRNSEYKRSCHDSSVHIPLVIRGGAFRGGIKDERLVSLLDIPVTLLCAAGIDVPESYEGTDIARGEERDCVFIQISESGCARAVRTKRYTYCVTSPVPFAGMTMKASPVYKEEFLYDAINDPYQLDNLVHCREYEQVKKELKKLLLREIKKAEGKTPRIIPAVKKRR